MAKSKSFFGLRKGSTKTMTYSVLRGQQITKDRVTDIANPKTMDQTLQRIPFAQAVKFYKQATRGLFRFAFEDKAPLESDYNAFMRHNVKYANSVSLTNYRDINYPSFGNWLLASGSLLTPNYYFDSEGTIGMEVGEHSSALTTIGAVSELLVQTYGYAEGDIVTFVCFQTWVDDTGALEILEQPSMKVNQFVIDSNSSVTLTSLGFENVATDSVRLKWDALDPGYCNAAAVIISRNTPSGLKVSEAPIAGNANWLARLTEKKSLSVKKGDAYSWGAAEKAILQGSLSD